jgi:hypothetical protein
MGITISATPSPAERVLVTDDRAHARLAVMSEVHRRVATELKLRDSQMHEAVMMANLVECFAPDVVATVNLMAAEFTPGPVKLAAARILLKRAELAAHDAFGGA